MIQLVMFDFDGTLVDTGPGLVTAINRVLIKRGRPELSREKVLSAVGGGLEQLVGALDPEDADTPEKLTLISREFLAEYEQVYLSESFLYPGVLEFLEKWPYEVAVVSNKSERFIHGLVNNGPLKNFPWAALIGGDSLPQKKPHPLPLEVAIQNAGVERAEAVMVGDGLPDFQAAKALGIPSVAVSYGYGALQDLMEAGAHLSIDHCSQLHDALQSLNRVLNKQLP